MSKKVCICGAEQKKEKPLVITITTCKNRHCGQEKSKSKCTDISPPCFTPCSSTTIEKPKKCKPKKTECDRCCRSKCAEPKKCPPSCSSTTINKQKTTRQSDCDTIDSLRYSSEEQCPALPKCPTKRGQECCPCPPKRRRSEEKCPCPPSRRTEEAYPCPSKRTAECPGSPRRTEECPGPPRRKEECPNTPRCPEAPCPPRRIEECPGPPRRKEECPNTTRCPEAPCPPRRAEFYCPPTPPTASDECPASRGRGEPVHIASSCAVCNKKRKKDKKKEKKRKKCDECCKPPPCKDKSLNCPSQQAVKLPILIPRYHGPGCAMEVDVLEKHDKCCKLKKQKNPKRQNCDDRSGSYEVIGRIIFKTCQSTPKQAPCRTCPDSGKLATIYSLFNIPYNFQKKTKDDQAPNKEEQRMRFLQKYVRHQKVLENLAKSSKSFPTNLNQYECEFALSECENLRKDIWGQHKNRNDDKSYEVEEIYISDQLSNRSIQMETKDKSSSSKHKLKKWFYLLFPCLLRCESRTSLGCSEIDNEYKDRRYDYME